MFVYPHPTLNKTEESVGQKKKLFCLTPPCACSKGHVFDSF